MKWKFWKRDIVIPDSAVVPEARTDGWENILTGVGQVGRDKSMSSVFVGDELHPDQGEQLWQFDDLAAKVVEKIPEQAFREGFEFNVPDDKQLAEDVEDYAEELGVESVFQHAMSVERALGGAAVFPVINDGAEDLSLPLREDRISEIRQLIVFDVRELTAKTYYDDFTAGHFGRPETYWLQPLVQGAAMPQATIHESRLIIFPGIRITRRADLLRNYRGWGLSVLTRCHRVLRQYNISWDSAGALLHDFSQAVIKVDGLAEMLAVKGEDAVRKRLLNLDLQRSIIRAMILDSKEDFQRTPTPMSGLPELLDRFATRFSAAADIPVSILFGDQPSGLNATGAADHTSFNNTVRAVQRKHLKPRLEQMFRLILLSKGGPTRGKEPKNWVVKFNALEQMSELDTATLHNKQADTDVKYISAGVISPEEVAISRFGGDEYSLETTIDVAGRGEPKAPDNTPPEPAPAPPPASGGPVPPGTPVPPGGPATKRVDVETLDDIDFLGLYGDLRLDDFDPKQPRSKKNGEWVKKGAAGAEEGGAVEKKKFKLTQIGNKPGNYTGADKGGGHAIQKMVNGQWQTVSGGHSEVSAGGQALHLAEKTGVPHQAVVEHTGAAVKPSELAATYGKRLTTNYKSVQWHKENDPKIKAKKEAEAAKPTPAPATPKPPTPHPKIIEGEQHATAAAAHEAVGNHVEAAQSYAKAAAAYKAGGFDSLAVHAKNNENAALAKHAETIAEKKHAMKEAMHEAAAPAPFYAEVAALKATAETAHPASWSKEKVAAKEAAKEALAAHGGAKTPAELNAAAEAFHAVGNKASSAGSLWGKDYHDLAEKMSERAAPPDKNAALVKVHVPATSARPISGIKGVEMAHHDFTAARQAFTAKLTPKEKSSVLSYSGASYSHINHELRSGKTGGEHVKYIDSALAKSPMAADTVVYRGISHEGFQKLTGAAGSKALKPGDQFVERGYSSTSAHSGSAFHSDHNFVITIPKGYHAAAIPSHHSSENEVLVRRNTKYEVTKIEHGQIHVTAVHDEP